MMDSIDKLVEIAQADAVPDNWQLVPIQPTDKLLEDLVEYHIKAESK